MHIGYDGGNEIVPVLIRIAQATKHEDKKTKKKNHLKKIIRDPNFVSLCTSYVCINLVI